MSPSPTVHRLAWLAVLTAVAALNGGCRQDPDDDDTAVPELDGSAAFALNPDNRFAALATVVVNRDADVVVEYGEAGSYALATPSRAVTAGEEAEIVVLGLRADTTFELRAVASDGAASWTSPSVTLTTEPLPAGWPSCNTTFGVDVAEFGEREIICTDGLLEDETPLYYCMDRNGVPLWELRHPDGERMRHVEPLSNGHLLAAGQSSSFMAIFDGAGRLLTEYSPLWFQGKTRFEHLWIDAHEGFEITQGPWAGAVALLTIMPDMVHGNWVVGNGVVVLDLQTEEVLWDWSVHGVMGDDAPIDDSLDYERQGQYMEEGGDWLHANALLHGVDEQDRQFFWLSLRAQDWIIKLDVATDAVVWRLGYEGEFELVDDLETNDPTALEPNRWMFQQHAPEWLSRDGSRTRFVVFDNGNERPDPLPAGEEAFSRVVVYEIDEETHQAAILFDLGDGDPASPDHFASLAYGDADMLPDGEALLFDVGLVDPGAAFIAEVSYPEGSERWRYDCPQGPTMFQANFHPDLYEMTWRYQAQR